MTQLNASDGPDPNGDWWKMSARERTNHLNALWFFTRTLVRSYRLPSPVVPPCWFRHDDLVQEISALRDYRDEQCLRLTAASFLDFHAQLQLWIARMRFWVAESGCTGNEHVVRTPPTWAVPGSSAAMKAEEDLDQLLDSFKKSGQR